MRVIRFLLSISVAALAACASDPPRMTQPEATPEPPPRNVLAAIRDQALPFRGTFHVDLIREPAVADAIEASHQAEMHGDRRSAELALGQVLDDPEARQRYAELLLVRGEPAQAEQLARESWESGPKVGEWCARSWFTIAEARELQNAPNGARQARDRAEECRPPRVDRY